MDAFWLQWEFQTKNQKWHFGCPNQNSKTTFQYKHPPWNPHLDTLGTILDPGKVIFGHFIAFGHFPIEIPIEAKKIYGQQKEGSYIKNKNCFEN